VSNKSFHLCAVASLALLLPPAALLAQAPVPDSPQIEHQVDAMLAKLTLQQKLELIGGQDSMFIRAEPAAGFPRLKMSDGPVSVRTWGPDTGYAAGIALAASWDPELARQVGEALGQDARARGVHFLLGPGVNIYRAPMNGRNFEYFGEDPFLSGHTAAAYIQGVQSQGVIATVKHFDANNAEYDRHNLNSVVDERTLHEIYLPAFEDAVKLGHVGAVMDSYNLINGEHATQNQQLNIDILKNEWKFNGILMSDWDATYSGVGAANGGLDLEMPSGKFMNPANLLPAIRSGQVSEATIDDKVRRIFRDAIRFGFLDRDQTDLSIPRDNAAHAQVALDEALESITLLKNQGNVLPLDANRVHTLAVIGPDAWPAVEGGGSSHADPFAPVSLLDGLVHYDGGKIKVLYLRGLPTLAELFNQTEFDGAQTDRRVKIETFDNPGFQGTPTVTYSGRINHFRSEEWTPSAAVRKSVRMTATFTPKTSGAYLLVAGAGGSDTYQVILDGKTVLEQPKREGQAPQSTEVQLEAGHTVHLQIDYLPDASYPRFGFGLRAAADVVSPEVAKIAAMADAAVVAVGFDASTESEGFDRSYTLPWGQDELINAVSQANRNTIVTLNAGGGVDTHRWLANVPVLLHTWYPGQEGGTALAEILFGDHDPEGRLPISFATSWEANPVHDNYYAAPVAAGQNPQVHYAEGLYLGYRYYTTLHKEPLFPFGFGLSYTSFEFHNLQVSPATAPLAGSGDGAGEITVSFDVTNTGQRRGATVAQVYVGDPSARVKRPVEELKGYQKVRLAPGETQHVALTLDRRALAYWSVATHGWQVDPGRFVVAVGDSSAHTPLQQSFTVR
jgi:beta-glucosidase